MSRPMAHTPKRRPRRAFTDEFKASAVRLVLDEGKTVGAAARDLDLTETALREWVKRSRADRTHGRTGVEMEALTGASVAALTFYDMAKAVTHGVVIREVRLIEKTGGKRDYRADQP